MRILFLYLAALALILAGCEASFNLSAARLSDPAMSTAIDTTTKAPLEKATIFPADVKTLYATVQIKGAPADTGVKAVFHYLEGNKQQIAEDTVKTEGSRYVSFTLNPPETGWPVGRYEVEFLLNNEVKEKIGFSIVPAVGVPVSQGFPNSQKAQDAAPASSQPAPATAAPSQPAPGAVDPITGQAQPATTVPPGQETTPPAQTVPPSPTATTQMGVTYKTFRDKQFGFSFELPENWSFQTIGANSDYLFSGPVGSPESEISVIVQIVDTQKGVVTSLKDQMLSLLTQFSGMAGAKIATKSEIQVAGQAAPFFLVTYPAENTQKQRVTFGHTQLGVNHLPYLLLVSYSAPREIYQQNVSTFQHMMDTLKLAPPVM